MHDVHSTNSSTNKHKERKTMATEFFEVSPKWMKACGHEGEENIMEIVRIQHFGHAPDWCKNFYTLKTPWGKEWLVAGGRGKPVK